MKSKKCQSLHIVEPFVYSFVLTNRLNGQTIAFFSIDDVLTFVRCRGNIDFPSPYLPQRFSTHPRLTPYEKDRMAFCGPQWYLSNHLGRTIEQYELEDRLPFLPERGRWKRVVSYEFEPPALSRRLMYKKNAPEKIKMNRQHVQKHTWRGLVFTSVLPLYRHVRTQNERRQTHHHNNEWGGEFHNLCRPSRKKLPTYYDDTLVAQKHAEKSWKHHSKRRKQWIDRSGGLSRV